MDIQEALTELNLTPREAQIYLALLEMGQATPLKLSTRTGLKRPTVYLDLESLRRKKLAGLAFQGKKSVYVPESPTTLVRLMEEQERKAKEILPLLKALENKGGKKPQIRYFDQSDDIARVWDTELFRAKEVAFITSLTKLEAQYPVVTDGTDKLITAGRFTKYREILTPTKEDRAYAAKPHPVERGMRIAPADFDYHTDIELWEDNVGLYSIDGRYLLVITDASIVKSFRALFEQLWKVSTVPKKS
ncbi:MAG: helix-turn-helix domain-containing protein [Patescibacteria group bacterium]|jgi:sugar-specific transcriptional regulator TrmB